MSEDNGLPIVHALRISPRAERDIEAHTVRMADMAGPEIARLWYQGLLDSIATLSLDPRRCAVIKENSRFRRQVRQLLYRRTAGGPAWRILFSTDEETEDGPVVNVLHVRHGAQRPITQAEAREIEP